MEFCLAEGELIRLEGGREGLVLRCMTGTLWLTKGDGLDYLIQPGRPTTLAKNEAALVEALEQSELNIGEPRSTGNLARPVIGLAGC